MTWTKVGMPSKLVKMKKEDIDETVLKMYLESAKFKCVDWIIIKKKPKYFKTSWLGQGEKYIIFDTFHPDLLWLSYEKLERKVYFLRHFLPWFVMIVNGKIGKGSWEYLYNYYYYFPLIFFMGIMYG